MLRKALLSAFLLCGALRSFAAFIPITVTGYTADVVANGTGPASGSITADVDGVNYAFVAANFLAPPSTTPPAYSLPNNGLINSANTPGLSFQMASFSANNSLRLASQGASGTLTFTTPTSAGEVYVMGTGGSGACVADIRVTFTDATFQDFTGLTQFNDWYNGTTAVTAVGLGRVNVTSNALEGTATGGPKLYEAKLVVLPANYGKQIASITVTKTNTGTAVLQIMGVSINSVCSGAPTAGTAATASATICSGASANLTLTGSTSDAGISFQWQYFDGTAWQNVTTGTGFTTTNFTTAALTAATQFRAAVICTSSNQTTYSNVVTITPVSAFLPPYNETFESITAANQMPNCMTATSIAPYVYTYLAAQSTYNRTNHTSGGSKFGAFRYGSNDYMFTPAISLTAGTSYIYSFWYIADGLTGFNLKGTVGTAATAAAQTTTLGTPLTNVTNTTYQQYVGFFTAPTTGTYYFGINCTASSNPWYLSIDDINITALPPCTVPTAQPTALVLTPGASAISVSYTAASPAPQRYLVVRSNGAALNTVPASGATYTVGGTLGNGTVAYIGNGTSFVDQGLTSSASYTYTVFAFNDSCSNGPLYRTASPLTGTTATTAPATYTWNGSISSDWQVAGNWTPARNVPDPIDLLQFNNGAVNLVNNIPTQTVRRITFSNNTRAQFQSPSAATLTLASDNVATSNELDIAAGSVLVDSSTAAALTIAFSGTGATVNVAGNLEVWNATPTNNLNFTNATVTVSAAGVIAAGGTNGGTAITSTTANLIINGTYQHKYTTNSGMAVPTATWNTGSTVLISGYTTATGGPNGGMNQVFYNFTYNCPNQTVTTNWSGTGPLTVTNNFTLTSTGTGALAFTGTSAYTYAVNNYIQTGGALNLANGTVTAATNLNITGSFNQTGGSITTSGSPTGLNVPNLNFNGTSGAQSVAFAASPTGRTVIRVSNPAGINLTGTGGLTALAFDAEAGVRISTTAANPINTALILTYNAGSRLTYDATGNVTATANVWTAAVPNVTTALGNNSVVTVPFSRTISGTLSMNSGDIDLGGNTLTIGASAAAAGTLTYTAGYIRVSSAGSLVRWYATTGLPTSAGTGVGYYPLAYLTSPRTVQLYFSSATALSAGGTIAVGHTNVTGMTTGLTVADGTYIINTRTNSFWNFTTGNGITASGTIGARVTGVNLFVSSNPANLRLMQASAVVGTHVAGAANTAVRTGLSLTDLAVPYYIGAGAADISGYYIAVQTGNWSTATTWDAGNIPAIGNDALINPGVTVTVDATTTGTPAAKSLSLTGSSALTVNAATLTIDDALNNSGSVTLGGGTLTLNATGSGSGFTNNSTGVLNLNSGTLNIGTTAQGKIFTNNGIATVAGGTLNLGVTGGGSAAFTSNGTLTVSGGTTNINGGLTFGSASVFNQSGGNIIVDGNAANVAANSVSSTSIVTFNSSSLNLTGGNITVVDPNVTSSGYAVYYSNGTNANIPAGHTFTFGNGLSSDGTTNTNGFVIYPNASSGRISFGNIVINGPSATNRWVRNIFGMGVNGNFTMNGGEFWVWDLLNIAGNLTVNAGATFTSNTSYVMRFGQYLNSTSTPSVNPQTVGGAGTFRNAQTSPTANFSYITVNNTAGVTFNTGDASFSNTLTFAAGATGPSRLIMPGTSKLIEIAGAGQSGASAANGWVFGTYQKAAATGGINNLYPIGDATNYTPVTIAGGAGAVTTAGSIAVTSIPGDHPSINTSNINPLRSINRYWKVDAVGGIAFGAGLITVTPTWVAADVDPGTVVPSLIMGRYSAAAWTYPTVSNPTAVTLAGLVAGNAIDGEYAVGQTCVPTVITGQPQSQTLCNGSSVTFNVTATAADGFTYQWKKSGISISNATASSFTIASIGAGDAGNYTVTITSPCGNIAPLTSNAAVLIVSQPVTITTQPVSQTVCQRRPVTFSVVAANGANYVWRKNGNVITGAPNSPNYTIANVVPGDAGSYSVDVIPSAPCPTVASAVATLTVNPLSNVTTAASTTNFCTGGSVVLNAVVASNVNYQWYNGTTQVGSSSSYTATTSGSYVVVVTNTVSGCKDTSTAINVSVGTPPVSFINPAPTAFFCAGDSVLLHGPTTNGVTFTWKRNGAALNGASDSLYWANQAGNYTLVVASGPACFSESAPTNVIQNALPVASITAATSTTICQGDSVLLQANAGTNFSYQWRLNGSPAGGTGITRWASQAGNWTVAITNANGCVGVSNSIAVNVNPLPAATITPASATTFCAGINVVLNANTSTSTTLNYQWLINGTAQGPYTAQPSYTAVNSGNYQVRVRNNATGCFSLSPVTAVTSNPLPVITTTPAGPNVGICAGSSLTISVPNNTAATYQWNNSAGPISGATSASYTTSTGGSYTVTAVVTATGCTATSSPVNVTVNPLPTVTTNPTGQQSVCDGDTLQIVSAATGTGLTYLWKIGTATIQGATLPNYGATVAGNYSVEVTNQFGCKVTSAPVVLTIKPKPLAFITYQSPLTFCQGGAVVLSANNTEPGLSYQWYRNGQPFSNPAYFYSANIGGLYTVLTTNSVGCSRLSAPVSVTINPKPTPVIIENPLYTLKTAANNYASYQWYRNNLAIAGATAPSYIVTRNGSYNVRVTDTNGCENTSDQHLINSLAVGNPAVAQAVRIFPNPTSGILKIEAPVAVKVTVRDMRGSTVFSQQQVQQIDLSGLADGLYMVLISDLDGQLLKMERVNKASR